MSRFSGPQRRGATRDAKELRRIEAEERQAAFDAEVAKVMREQNCGPVDARYIVNSRSRFEQRLLARMLANPLVQAVQL